MPTTRAARTKKTDRKWPVLPISASEERIWGRLLIQKKHARWNVSGDITVLGEKAFCQGQRQITLVNQGESLATLDPFLTREYPRREFDETRKHVENGHRAPFSAFARTKSLLVELFRHFGEGNILDN